MEQPNTFYLVVRVQPFFKRLFHKKPLEWYLYTSGTCHILRKILTKDIITTEQPLRKMNARENTDPPSLLQGGGEGRTHSRFGSDPSGLLKPASLAETQAAKQSLSSKVIVSICQQQKLLAACHLDTFSKRGSKPLFVLFN